MSDLLKEAIADAKTVRETAIANAKMALEEAFTPHLKSMLSAKLAEEDDEEDNDEGMHDNDEMRGDEEEGMHDNDEMRGDNEEGMHGDEEEGMHDDDEDAEEMREEDIIEIDGVKYAPVMSEEDDEEDNEEGMREEEELDLESVIKELETEIAESEGSDDDLTEGDDEDDDKKDEVKEDIVTEEDDEDDKDDMDEQSTSSGIGAGDNKVKQPSASDEEDPGKGKIKESVEDIKAELKEYKEAVTFLREKLHEVNILNAKLLYTNRLFKEYVLSNDQKLKIVETFDRAQTTREIKLVYSTLAESFKNGDVKKGRVQESASKKSGTTKPTQKIITEESQVADRFKKLAGIL